MHSRRRRGGRGAVAPPFGLKRRKSSKIRANGLFIWANSLDIWAHHCQNTVSVSVKTFFFFFFFFFWRTPTFGQKNRSNFGKDLFFFFFLENTFIWTEKPFKFRERPFFFFFFLFFGEHLNLGRKNRLNIDRETQCIKSFFGQKFAAPPNHFELLRP